eukprot:GGOE01003946.1.p1 GENE.GGOE01003946.1~~GGOE01003946.1.p1  ORF type:complete len:324 (-),score=111.94 GGOE01003946.1:448-1389(-)
MAADRCVLSIQSHVVHGYVGNKCATFTLQVLGFDVDAVNTVHFSNHTAYPTWSGEVLSGEQLAALLQGLQANDLICHSHVLTGYIGRANTLQTALDVIRQLKQRHPQCVYLCDPVLGDNGQLYVPPELVSIYRDVALQYADIATPNQFEAELLSGFSISSLPDACKVASWFHSKGVQKVVITSMEFAGDSAQVGTLILLGSSKQATDAAEDQFIIRIPTLSGSYTGSGDTLSALILGWNEIETDFSVVCEKAVAAMQAVIQNTMEHAASSGALGLPGGRSADPHVVANRELRLVQSKRQLENPTVLLRAERLR